MNASRELVLGDWVFNAIDIKDKELYSRYIKETQYPTNLWSSNFDYLWGVSDPHSEQVVWKVVDGMLVTFKRTKKGALQIAFPPFGPGDPGHVSRVLYKCLRYCVRWNRRVQVKALVRVITKQQLDFLSGSRFFQHRFRSIRLAGMDRHVGVKKLVDLSGGEFSEVRYNRNHFIRHYPDVVVRRAEKEDFEPLLDLKRAWNQSSGQKYAKIWDDRFYVQIIRNHQELDHIVLVAETGGLIVGMVTGGILPHGQAWGALLKAREGYRGLFEFLNICFAVEIHKIAPWVETINLGTDVGVNGGLRRFKDKFNPVFNSERYRLCLK